MDWVSPAVERNAQETANRVNALLAKFGESRSLTSGFRDPESNKLEGGANYSRHMYGMAADIVDKDGSLKRWAAANPELVAQCLLWCEPLHMTPTWLHVQTVNNPQNEPVPK